MKIAVYAGTFDPITRGHLNVLASAARVFDQVIVGVAVDNNKHTLIFSGGTHRTGQTEYCPSG